MAMNRKTQKYLIAILLTWLILAGIFMIQHRWINPDEGAHLGDGKLLLEGKVPLIDYQSRQPFYVSLLAIALKIFGMSYVSGRILMLIASLFIALGLFLMTKKLFSEKIAMVVLILYVFFPFTILYTAIVKMHNIVILFGIVGIILFINYFQSKKYLWLLASGIFMGLAFYIRESSLAWTLTIAITIILTNKKKFFHTLKELLVFSGGFVLVVCIVFAIYTQFQSLADTFNSPLNPLDQPIIALKKVLAIIGIGSNVGQVETARIQGQSFATSWRELRSIFRMNFYLFFAFGLFVVYFVKDLIRDKKKNAAQPLVLFLLPTWLLTSAVVYGYYFFARGFFPAYALEIYPPLLICLAFLIGEKFSGSEKHLFVYLTAVIAYAFGLFFIYKIWGLNPDFSIHFVLGFLVAAIYRLSNYKRFRQRKIMFWLSAAAFLFLAIFLQSTMVTQFVSGRFTMLLILILFFGVVGYFYRNGFIARENSFTALLAIPLLFGALTASFGESARYLSVSYYGVWPPSVEAAIGNKFDELENKATLLSGGMIWAIHPKIEPYHNITHPTAFVSKVPAELSKQLIQSMESSPPDFIVLDGYTFRGYHFIESFLKSLIEEKYQPFLKFDNERQTVQVFQKKQNLTEGLRDEASGF